jgi:hypothetical protein
MTTNDPEAETQDEDWPHNYFNYFTEIEEHFQRARSSGLFLLSPLDWALIENWKNSGIPLEAVLHGIDNAFEKWHSRKQKTRSVNSVAYCTQAVMEAAERAPSRNSRDPAPAAPFSADELRQYLEQAASQLRQQMQEPFQDIARKLDEIAGQTALHMSNIEELERLLTALEDKMVAAARSLMTDQELLSMRTALDRELRPYRSKMTADQLAMLEHRYLDSAVLEHAKLPRLSLFYMR